AMKLANVTHQLAQVDFLRMEIETGTALDEARRGQQIVDQMGHAQNGGTNLARTSEDLVDADPLLKLVEALRVAVDDGQRRAEFMRGHRDEVTLQRRELPLGVKLLFEHRGLSGKSTLRDHELDRIVAKTHGRPRHFADLILALSVANLDVRVVGGEAMHI